MKDWNRRLDPYADLRHHLGHQPLLRPGVHGGALERDQPEEGRQGDQGQQESRGRARDGAAEAVSAVGVHEQAARGVRQASHVRSIGLRSGRIGSRASQRCGRAGSRGTCKGAGHGDDHPPRPAPDRRVADRRRRGPGGSGGPSRGAGSGGGRAHAGVACGRRAAGGRRPRPPTASPPASATWPMSGSSPPRPPSCSATWSGRTPPASASRSPPRWCGPCSCCGPTPWPWASPGVRPEVVELLIGMLNASGAPGGAVARQRRCIGRPGAARPPGAGGDRRGRGLGRPGRTGLCRGSPRARGAAAADPGGQGGPGAAERHAADGRAGCPGAGRRAAAGGLSGRHRCHEPGGDAGHGRRHSTRR